MNTPMRAPHVLPSGVQHRLRWKEHSAVVVEVGGGIREYSVAGVRLMDDYGEHDMCPGAAGMVLAPWPNRIRGGRYEFGGRVHQLPITELEHGNALHGLVRWLSWSAHRRGSADVEMTTTIHPQPGYPFSVVLSARWSLSDEGLRAIHTATNMGDGACPFGLAVHPYFRVADEPADALLLSVPATRVIDVDADGIPVAKRAVAGTDDDYRISRCIGDRQIDAAFGELERDSEGRSRVEVRGPHEGGALVWMDRSFPYVQIFTSDTLDPPRRRRSVAVEPMTCPANAFNTGEGRIVLSPGETWHGVWGVTPL